MKSLHHIQSLFYQAAIARSYKDDVINEISEYINATPDLSPRAHFKIYRDSITATMFRALREIYPVCHRLVGERFFDGMGTKYFRQYPSTSADLAEYGGEFARFISDFEPASALPYLPDVAKLELAWHKAFHARDETSLNVAALSQIFESDTARIVFQLSPSAHLVESEFPVHRIWQVNQPDYKGDEQVDLDEGGIKLIVWRKQGTMRVDPLEDDEWLLLMEIYKGKDFKTICETALGQSTNIDVVRLLPQLVQRAWISDFQLVEQ